MSRTSTASSRGPRLQLDVQYAVDPANLPSPKQFRSWMRAALKRDATVAIRIVGSREARTLNRSFRGRDYATNVLTFVMDGKPPFRGDIALCAPVVAREARAQKKPLEAHYAHLAIHGMLHLQGYDHEAEAEASRMEALEKRIMSRLGYDDPYAAR